MICMQISFHLRFRLFTRLFFVMGLLWVCEMLSFITTFLDLDPQIQTLFVFTDCLNALQGVAVFFIFVWKPQTFKQLKKKWIKALNLDSQASLINPYTIKTTSVKSSIKSSRSSSCKASSPT